jgi:hypothetical protein
MTTQQSLALATTETTEAVKITQYAALLADIKIAEDSAIDSFAYHIIKGEKDAKKYISNLRGIRAKIEKARKEAKAYALEYGRSVDTQAKALDARITALIAPPTKTP